MYTFAYTQFKCSLSLLLFSYWVHCLYSIYINLCCNINDLVMFCTLTIVILFFKRKFVVLIYMNVFFVNNSGTFHLIIPKDQWLLLYLFELTFQFFRWVLKQYTLKMTSFTISCILYLYEYIWHSMNLKYLFLWTFFLVIFAFLWSTLWISCNFLEQIIMYTPYIFFPGLIFDFFINCSHQLCLCTIYDQIEQFLKQILSYGI